MTEDDFDPYHEWLGIAPKDQPPNHYRLLGVDLFEDNPDVVSHAADRQMGHVRTFQSGRRAAQSQRLLNEISAARVCLLTVDQKSSYDAALKDALAGVDVPAAASAGEGATIAVGSIFGEYILSQQISDDKKGPVFKAEHRTMGRVVAVKFLSEEAARNPELVERFRRKVKILANLHHPNLVAAYDAGKRGDTLYLTMEYVDGHDLNTLRKMHDPLPVPHVVNYISQAAAGLGYAHARGVLHRNIKPGNLMVDRQGFVKVIGLGMAGLLEGGLKNEIELLELTQPGRIMGTFDYMSPEQAVESRDCDHRTDIYALGCTLCTLLTGKPPYPVKSPMKKILAHRSAKIPSLCELRPDVPESLDAVFRTMLAKKPENRFASMEEVMTALQGC